MTETYDIWNLSPAEMRGYALGLRQTELLLGASWQRAGMVAADEMSMLVEGIRLGWQREATLVEGFAARLGAMEADAEADDESEEWRGLGERLFPAPEDEEDTPIAFWLAADPEAGHFPTAEDAADTLPLNEITAIASNIWPEPRHAVRIMTSDAGDTELHWFNAEAEARCFLASAGADIETAAPTPAEAAQEGLAEAVAESLAQPAEPQPATLRSDSPWTEARLALLRRLFPTIMTLDGIRQALLTLPGIDIATPDAVKVKAQRLDLHRRGAPIPEEYAEARPVRVKNLGGLASNGGKPGTWTAERVALLRRDYPSKRSMADIFAEVNALPGPAVPTIGAVAAQAKKIGLSRKQSPEVGPPIAPPAAITDMPMTTEDKAEALERLRKGVDKGAKDTMEYFGCTHAEALALVDQHRTRMGKAA